MRTTVRGFGVVAVLWGAGVCRNTFLSKRKCCVVFVVERSRDFVAGDTCSVCGHDDHARRSDEPCGGFAVCLHASERAVELLCHRLHPHASRELTRPFSRVAATGNVLVYVSWQRRVLYVKPISVVSALKSPRPAILHTANICFSPPPSLAAPVGRRRNPWSPFFYPHPCSSRGTPISARHGATYQSQHPLRAARTPTTAVAPRNKPPPPPYPSPKTITTATATATATINTNMNMNMNVNMNMNINRSHPLTARFSVSEDLNEVDFGGAEGLPKLLAAAVLAPAYFSWSKGEGQGLGRRAGRFGESGLALRRRAEAAAGTLLASCEEGGQVRSFCCVFAVAVAGCCCACLSLCLPACLPACLPVSGSPSLSLALSPLLSPHTCPIFLRCFPCANGSYSYGPGFFLLYVEEK